MAVKPQPEQENERCGICARPARALRRPITPGLTSSRACARRAGSGWRTWRNRTGEVAGPRRRYDAHCPDLVLSSLAGQRYVRSAV
jgi:hypothetical protein